MKAKTGWKDKENYHDFPLLRAARWYQQEGDLHSSVNLSNESQNRLER